MIKFLVIFFILLMVVMLLVIRYRRQLQTALHIWRMYKQIKQTPKKSAPKESVQKINKGESLVLCARCGKWILPSSAVKLGGNTVYCSTQCMEKAARLESLVDKS